jgi:hypothetical protein
VVVYRRLKATWKPEAVCGPGNCWTAITAQCTCSCEGKNHGKHWLHNLRPPR